MRDLYHGTVYDIDEIDVTKGKGYKDFGKGFYATSIRSHADNIARRNKRILEEKEVRMQKNGSKYRAKVYQAHQVRNAVWILWKLLLQSYQWPWLHHLLS